jgi:hypothetical protein
MVCNVSGAFIQVDVDEAGGACKASGTARHAAD